MIPSTVQIYVCVLPQDMRRSFDGLALLTSLDERSAKRSSVDPLRSARDDVREVLEANIFRSLALE